MQWRFLNGCFLMSSLSRGFPLFGGRNLESKQEQQRDPEREREGFFLSFLFFLFFYFYKFGF